MPIRKARRLVTLARLNAKAGRYERAAAEIEQAAAIFESNGFLQQELMAGIEGARILMQQRKYEEALKQATGIYQKTLMAKRF